MSAPELIALEREIEAARERVAGDLARLRSPATLAEFKNELWTEAREAKDQVVEKATDYVHETIQSVITDIKQRAAANPAAALAIGAGLAWQLLRRPPIASLLVGAGVVGLMKTQPQRDLDFADGLAAQASSVATAVKEQVQEWSAEASVTARETASQVADNVLSLADRASVKVASAGRNASAVIADTLPEGGRDQFLLGAAAVAIATAVGIASQRRSA